MCTLWESHNLNLFLGHITSFQRKLHMLSYSAKSGSNPFGPRVGISFITSGDTNVTLSFVIALLSSMGSRCTVAPLSDWLCMHHQTSSTRTEPLITPGAMDDPGTEMQPGPRTVSSVCQLPRWTRGWGDERNWDLEPALPHIISLTPLLMMLHFLELRATGRDFTTGG